MIESDNRRVELEIAREQTKATKNQHKAQRSQTRRELGKPVERVAIVAGVIGGLIFGFNALFGGDHAPKVTADINATGIKDALNHVRLAYEPIIIKANSSAKLDIKTSVVVDTSNTFIIGGVMRAMGINKIHLPTDTDTSANVNSTLDVVENENALSLEEIPDGHGNWETLVSVNPDLVYTQVANPTNQPGVNDQVLSSIYNYFNGDKDLLNEESLTETFDENDLRSNCGKMLTGEILDNAIAYSVRQAEATVADDKHLSPAVAQGVNALEGQTIVVQDVNSANQFVPKNLARVPEPAATPNITLNGNGTNFTLNFHSESAVCTVDPTDEAHIKAIEADKSVEVAQEPSPYYTYGLPQNIHKSNLGN